MSWTVPMVSFVYGWNGMDSQYQSRPEVACEKQRTLCRCEMLLYHVPVRRVNNGEMKSDQQRQSVKYIVEWMYWNYKTKKNHPN